MREEQSSVLAIYKADLEDQEAAYQEKINELESQKTVLAILQTDLDERTEELDEQQALIQEQEDQLLQQQSILKTQQEQLDEQQEVLVSQQVKLNEQQELLDEQAAQIEQIVGVQSQLIDELNLELAANQIQIQADQKTGAIIFESSILFATDSNELTEEGQNFFRKFMPVYLDVLLNEKFEEYIAEVILEGHTDDTGTYLHNLELSQQRALSVAEYLLGDACDFLKPESIAKLKTLLTVNGCADKAPIYREDGTIDGEKSRRVEIKFRLKDQEMIQEMDELLNQ
jgi:chemotaxis protein MotB